MKIAVAHDWLTTLAGSEKVLHEILSCFPTADLFTVVDFLPSSERDIVLNKKSTSTFIQKLPFAATRYRSYLPLMPLAIEQLDVSQYDLVISSNHAVAKGILTGPDQLHICYVHSPIRYAWDLQHQYLRNSGLDRGIRSWLARWQLHRIRLWDVRSANGVDAFIANSRFVARRIWKTWRRKAIVVYPPVDVEFFSRADAEKEDFYLTASRMVPYKRIDLVVQAFVQMPERRLVVIGDGPEFNKIKLGAPKNVLLLGYQSREVLRDYMQRAKAFIFAAEEDFGIVPVEAQACGTPVIAYARGGALETVRDLSAPKPTGLFFDAQTVSALHEAVERMERDGSAICADDCRLNAQRFSESVFRDRFGAIVAKEWNDFSAKHSR